MSEHAAGSPPDPHAQPDHVVPIGTYVMVFLALMVGTGLTVAASYVDLGIWNTPVAMLIAVTKASLVVFFFMHLKWDRPVNAIIFLSSLAFVVLFIGFAMTDTGEYQPDIAAYTSTQP